MFMDLEKFGFPEVLCKPFHAPTLSELRDPPSPSVSLEPGKGKITLATPLNFVLPDNLPFQKYTKAYIYRRSLSL